MTGLDTFAPSPRGRQGTRVRAFLCACALVCMPAGELAFADEPTKIAVFPFELVDFSAAGGVVATDGRDAKYLTEATDEAKKWLAESGRYALVDTSRAEDEPVKTHTLHDCKDCVGPITKKLGADQAVVGTITRISRTEYTLLIQVFDAATGEPASNYFTGLRMGADYAWARGVRSLMKNRILAKSDRR